MTATASSPDDVLVAPDIVPAICSASIPLNVSPGPLLPRQTAGTNQSFGETATLTCAGNVDGLPVTEAGSIGFPGNYSGTFSAAGGGGTCSFTVPVNDHGLARVIHHSGTCSAPNVTLAIAFNGQFETSRPEGQGNRLTQPMTKATLPMVGVQLTP